MKKLRSSSLFILFVCSAMLCTKSDKDNDSTLRSFQSIRSKFELDSKILLKGSDIFFSANDSSAFNLYKCDLAKKQLHIVNPTQTNLFNPFIFSGKIAALMDYDGDEQFVSTASGLNEFIGRNSIDKIYSFNDGKSIFLQVKKDEAIYFIDTEKGTKKILPTVKNKLHGVEYCEKKDLFGLSFDESLILISVKNHQVVSPAYLPSGEKLNPFINGSQPFFVSNNASEYYQIFRTELDQEPSSLLLYGNQP